MSNFPALEGLPVTEGHAKTCQERGHATHIVNGEHTYICARCGERYELDNHGKVKATSKLSGVSTNVYAATLASIRRAGK